MMLVAQIRVDVRLDRIQRGGSRGRMAEIVLAEEHVQIYDLWRARGDRGMRVVHVDFHCDMRGLLVDRVRGVAWIIDERAPRMRAPDSGNFLAHAVAGGIVGSVRWVHDPHGGRRYDVGTVKYESDLTAAPHRWLHRWRGGAEAPLAFEERTLETWGGVRPGEHLDLDWDAFASVDYEVAKIRRLTAEFLDRDLGAAPVSTSLVYSPGYSHPDRSLFERFAQGLAEKLGAAIVRLPPPPESTPRSRARGPVEALERSLVLACHRVGIY